MIHIKKQSNNIEIENNVLINYEGASIFAESEVKNVKITNNLIVGNRSKSAENSAIVQINPDTDNNIDTGIFLTSGSKIKGMFLTPLTNVDNYTRMKHSLQKKSFMFKIIEFLKIF